MSEAHLRPQVLIIAQAFKETLSASVVGAACAEGVRAAGADPIVMCASDGGDGLLEALEPVLHRATRHNVTDPVGRRVEAPVGWLDERVAVVESRLACGLSLLEPTLRNPLRTTTRGVGELVAQAIQLGAMHVFVGLGGSATMDGGLGMARAWGWVPQDAAGKVLPEGGGALSELQALAPGRRLAARLTGLIDVKNPLLGPEGARVYAEQKGATPEATEQILQGLERLADQARASGGGELAEQPGAGAAGGLGFGILFFGGGELVPGAPWMLERLGFDQKLSRAAAIMTGEGSFDLTSTSGKLTGEVLVRARRASVPAVLLAPRVEQPVTGVVVETGGGHWDAAELTRRAESGARRVLRLPR